VSKEKGALISLMIGAASALFGDVVGWLVSETVFQALLLGFVGALGGYIFKKSLELAIKISRKFKK